MYAFNGTTLVDAAQFSFNATGLNSNTPVWSETPPTTHSGQYQLDVDQSQRESIAVAGVPEPMTYILIGTGLIGLGLLRRKTATN